MYLTYEEYERERKYKALKGFTVTFIATTLFWFLIFAMWAKTGNAYTDEQIVNAIYKAEGGKNAQYLYGIRSVRYSTPQEARRICHNTVRNNRKRYAEYGYKTHGSYLAFLASRYCPVTGKGLSKRELEVNKYWLKNVMFFLGVK